MAQSGRCEAFRLSHCTAVLTDEDKFELRLKAELPSAAKYILRCLHNADKRSAWYILLVWLKEAQTVGQVTEWLGKVVVYPGGHKQEELLDCLSFPVEDQTPNEFVYEKYFGEMFCQSCNQPRLCRGNLKQEDIRPVDLKKFSCLAGFGPVFISEQSGESGGESGEDL